ncbi:ubiquinol-cytochrome c reductase complex assembly factor 2 [Arctopsyche grandis]|uniref:ubiquinol-cytochrome c reductase complex assembly factor 2 n=1 Tax=Arctopsyche grandis TaxID=121162 RepID=UPI00406D932A
MNSASRYRDFMRLLERWPLEPTKSGRDIGERIRECVKIAFNSEQFNGDPKYCDQQYKSLKNLSDNSYANTYKRNKPYSSTGLTAEECKLLLSNESLEYLKKDDRGLISKLFNRD